jgi:hypothetical protein
LHDRADEGFLYSNGQIIEIEDDFFVVTLYSTVDDHGSDFWFLEDEIDLKVVPFECPHCHNSGMVDKGIEPGWPGRIFEYCTCPRGRKLDRNILQIKMEDFGYKPEEPEK